MEVDLALLILRVGFGLTFAAHGAQKVFGWSGGTGFERWTADVARHGFRPPRLFAALAAYGELVGGFAIAVGSFTPLAAAMIAIEMLVAIRKVSWRNGFWAAERGYEWPLMLLVVAVTLGIAGPGRYALDPAFGQPFGDATVFLVAALAGLLLTLPGLLARSMPARTATAGGQRSSRATPGGSAAPDSDPERIRTSGL